MPEKYKNSEYYVLENAPNFDNLPSTFIIVGNYDMLHDDGVIYHDLLKNSGCKVIFFFLSFSFFFSFFFFFFFFFCFWLTRIFLKIIKSKG